tara:strand:+ start:376 stop:825 length:450 start_codon:yes stop_codon:yes gene_type:complete
MLFKKLLDKITSNKSSHSLKLNFDCFKDDLNLAISILMIEVSKSDDEFSSEEKDKIISLLEHHFSLNQEQISVLIELAEEKNNEMISLYEWTSIINDNYDYPDRINVIKSLWAVAHADNKIDKYEDYTIRKIADLLYVRHEDFILAKHQ